MMAKREAKLTLRGTKHMYKALLEVTTGRSLYAIKVKNIRIKLKTYLME